MPEYTLLTMISIVAVVLAELLIFRTGVFRTVRYWLTMIIVWAFQIPVDGWLTRLTHPIVIYRGSEMLGLRFPWDIPIEDFGFGFSLVTLTIIVWERLGRRRRTARATTPNTGAR
ncbi:lycopene cyclase domain-containing protein [Microlunatus sp. Gsoil 973]|jgi:lycopene cyclase domain-containing protein|uniref:lycopene cyclase domain-containing protein n=1 Tax=Microlunatus sp. Gsoil 973 TaxID=2672569 RepID=UPI0012B443AE|nr:lycopene cyclase domain-containing protein [Microlunatus sp. Gsoil 973]QGN34332.1 lycopene cyclase domain-containing protein [Microlunatus sp. Gsoil 973]